MAMAEYSYEEDIQVKQQEAMQKGLVLSAQIFRTLQRNPDFTDTQIAEMVGCSADDV